MNKTLQELSVQLYEMCDSEKGWAFVHVPSEDAPSMTYTLGLAEKNLPELVVFGVDDISLIHQAFEAIIADGVGLEELDGIEPKDFPTPVRLPRRIDAGDGWEMNLVHGDFIPNFLAQNRYRDKTERYRFPIYQVTFGPVGDDLKYWEKELKIEMDWWGYTYSLHDDEETAEIYCLPVGSDELLEELGRDQDLFDQYLDDFHCELNSWMKELDPETEHWYVETENNGWQNRSGWAVFPATTSRELLIKALPATEMTIRAEHRFHEIYLSVSHHDSPTGESYYIRPATPEEVEENG